MSTFNTTEPKEYQVFLMIGQSLIQSSAFGGDSANINGRGFDDQIISQFQTFDDEGNFKKRTVRNNLLLRGADQSTGFDAAFARELYAQGERNIVILRYAAGGHSITAFLDEPRRLYPKPTNQQDLWPKTIPWMEERLGHLLVRGDTYSLRGMVMWQGSSDRSDSGLYTNYEAHLDRLKEDYRLTWPSMKWLQVVSPDWGTDTAVLTIQQAQKDSSDSDANGEYVLSDPALGDDVVFLDGTHPDSDSTEKVGVQVAREFLNLTW